MKKLLIVEDDQFKLQNIVSLLQGDLGVEDIVCAKSVVSAINQIDNNSLRLLILDLAIPNYDEGTDETSGLGGISVFRYLKELCPSVPVIVITQFEALKVESGMIDVDIIRSDLQKEFGPQFVTLIKYSWTNDEWKNQIKEYIPKELI